MNSVKSLRTHCNILAKRWSCDPSGIVTDIYHLFKDLGGIGFTYQFFY